MVFSCQARRRNRLAAPSRLPKLASNLFRINRVESRGSGIEKKGVIGKSFIGIRGPQALKDTYAKPRRGVGTLSFRSFHETLRPPRLCVTLNPRNYSRPARTSP